ncbi:MAG: hypothetical protein ABW223_06655 [Rariglobus sp.]
MILKISHFLRRFCFIGIVALALTRVGAQQESAAVETPPASISFMSWERPVTGLFVTADGKKYTEVHCPAYQFGRASQIKAGGTLKIYRRTEAAGEPRYEISQEVPLQADCTEFQAYVIRQADKEGLPTYRLIVMPNDFKAFPAGEVRLFNFSPFPAMARVGEQSHPLAPLEWKQLKVTPDRKYRVILMTALQVGETWVEGGRELMSLRPEYRGDVLIVHTKADLASGTGRITEQADARAMTIATTYYVPGTANVAPAKR